MKLAGSCHLLRQSPAAQIANQHRGRSAICGFIVESASSTPAEPAYVPADAPRACGQQAGFHDRQLLKAQGLNNLRAAESEQHYGCDRFPGQAPMQDADAEENI